MDIDSRAPTRGKVQGQPRRQRLCLAALVTLVAASLPALSVAASSPRSADAAGTRINAYLKGLAARNQLSGAVLVARQSTILLAKGYGMAVRESRVPNSPTTKYPVAGVSASISLVTALKLEELGKLRDAALICSYFPSCPPSWRSTTVGMVLDGTAGLNEVNWGRPGHTTAQSLIQCQGLPRAAAPGTQVGYGNCTVVVLGTILEKVTGKPWTTVIRQAIFRPARMTHSGRVTDSLLPPARAQDYSGSTPDSDVVYNDYFQVYSTLRDVYGYDNALFAGRILSHPSLTRLFAPRGAVSPPDANVTAEQQAAKWKVGRVVGHQVIFTTDDTKDFTAANMRFPQDGATVIVISNDAHDDVEAIAVHAAALLFGERVAPPSLVTFPAVNPTKRSS